MANIVNTSVLIDGEEVKRFSDFVLHQSIFEHHTFSLNVPSEYIDGKNGLLFQNSKNLIGKSITVQSYLMDDVNHKSGLQFTGVITQVSRSRFSGPHCKSWLQQATKNIANDVLKHFPKNVLEPDIRPVSRTTWAYCVQYKETAWNFLKRIAVLDGQ